MRAENPFRTPPHTCGGTGKYTVLLPKRGPEGKAADGSKIPGKRLPLRRPLKAAEREEVKCWCALKKEAKIKRAAAEAAKAAKVAESTAA